MLIFLYSKTLWDTALLDTDLDGTLFCFGSKNFKIHCFTLFLIPYSFDIKSTSFMSGNLPETNFDIIVIQRIINIYQLVTNVGLGPGH